jgi:signal transduction histidine kinase
MTLMDRAVEQFGPYRRACARIWCNALKVGVSIVPEKVHGLRPAVMIDKRCLVEGDDCCEWEVRWQEPDRWYPGRRVAISLARSILKEEIARHETVIEEQTSSLKSRHEELERAYVELQNNAVELQKRVDYLTTLHESGLTFTSTRDRDSLIDQALEVLMHKLSYDRVMISFYDPLRQVAHSRRIVGVPQAIAAFAQELEVPVVDPSTVEGRVLLLGQPVLVTDISQVRDQLHPYHRDLAEQTGTESFLSVPLKVKNWILGSLTVDRSLAHSLTQEDLELMMTFANQLAIALDNAAAYREIELLNAGLEEKIRDRTVQLEGANRQLTELNQLKSSFVSIVSHELRTPMTSMRIYVSNMLDGVIGALTDRQKQYLSRIEFNIDRLTRMIVDLLDLSSIEAGKVGLRLQAITVNELVEEVTENIRSLAADKSITLECAVSYPQPLEADRDKLTQILTNLLANGIKYSRPGGIVRISTELLQDAGSIRFCIADTGCGIQPEELPKVFETFFRGAGNTAETRGAGLGLAIVKSLVELHGGRVWVESIVGQGSSFYFTIPLRAVRESC